MPDPIAAQTLMLYFAYGSNMCTGRLKRRVPSAVFVRIATLTQHSFRFHKRSTDGSAKGDAFETGDNADCVWGVIFDIDPREKPALDEAEGLGYGYDEKTAIVLDEHQQECRAVLYFAGADGIDTSLFPYSWYKRFVIEGARQHHLPLEYVSVVAAMPDANDPNRDRDQSNRLITC